MQIMAKDGKLQEYRHVSEIAKTGKWPNSKGQLCLVDHYYAMDAASITIAFKPLARSGDLVAVKGAEDMKILKISMGEERHHTFSQNIGLTCLWRDGRKIIGFTGRAGQREVSQRRRLMLLE
jgi:hypothetical protein